MKESYHFKAVISGSFRKHMNEIFEFKERIIRNCNIEVLSPRGNHAKNPDEEFILLDADPISDHKTLQDNVFSKIKYSSFLIAFNKGGYMGNAMILEIGYAISQSVPVFSIEQISDPNIAPYVRTFSDVFEYKN